MPNRRIVFGFPPLRLRRHNQTEFRSKGIFHAMAMIRAMGQNQWRNHKLGTYACFSAIKPVLFIQGSMRNGMRRFDFGINVNGIYGLIKEHSWITLSKRFGFFKPLNTGGG